MGYSGEQKRQYQVAWLEARKVRGHNLLGGKCTVCNSTENLEVDHIDPTTKDPYLKGRAGNAFWSKSWKFIESELVKCQLLCDTCHNAKTAKENSSDVHGLTKYEKYGCRCDECKLAKRIQNAKRYAHNK